MKNLIQCPDFKPKKLTFGEVPCFQYNKSLAQELKGGMTKKDAIFLYEQMLAIRAFETMIVKLRSGELVPFEGYRFSGATHLSIGQEASAVGANAALKADDYITSSHRGHGHGIAKSAFALREMNDKQLNSFIAEVSYKSDKKTLLGQALDVHMYRTMTEFMGKEEGYCRGRGGGMHIADFNVGHLGANAIVGGSIPIATGAGISMMLQKKDRVTLCFFGDGASNNGVFCESLNMACMGQFERGVPVIFYIENNGFGMTGRSTGEVTGIDYLARRGWAYNEKGMHAEVVNGMDVLAVRDAVARAAEICRKGEGPVLLEVKTYRYMGHSLSDQNKYRSEEEIEAWKCEDAIGQIKQELVKSGVMEPQEVEDTEKRVYAEMEQITIAAANSAYPEASTIYEGLYSDSTSDGISADLATKDYNADAIQNYRDNKGSMPYRRAVLEAMTEEMLRDKRVVFYGEDVAEHGGAFAATAGLYEIFGGERVFNTAISEVAICGSAVGMAMTGMRPVCELMYIDFMPMAMDQLGNQAAKNKYMFGGKAVIPMVCRTTIGGGKGYAGQHSQSLEAIATQIPGLKVVVPSTPADVKGMLKTAIRDDNPVIFIEHQLLYGDRGVVPEGEHLVPFGKAAIRREGADVTIMAYSYLALEAAKAAEILAGKGVDAEVIDVRSLIPLDVETIIESIKKTNYGCVVSQAPGTGCFGEHIINQIQKKAFDYLDAPIELVAACEVPPPMAPTLEAENMPNAEKISAAVLAMLGKA
ncbi:MAG: dehydrogenase E1 component subunit alpha/beta [Sedimentisphaerales bacterium]|nr:dehydrogenase E1 component subunit alpha/beta [Sedimentisphaerales bacterium]